ncbi:hypothetical protein DFJ74DRAFT_674887 [Hyaloraphidium curvatum]|nr:hypothetical protein DFJ74DRAFT_674887 [Hyaloraphidium curvatum]
MVFEIKGKGVLVTGGTEGIGLAVVRRLLQEGARVVVSNRNEKLASSVLSDLRTEFGVGQKELAFVPCDICSEPSIRTSFEKTVAILGRVDAVVANAGFSSDVWSDAVANADDSGWLRGIQGNLVGTMLLGRLAATHWASDGGAGAFVVNSSIYGLHGYIEWGLGMTTFMSYAVSKAGLVQFVKSAQAIAELSHLQSKKKGKSPVRFSAVMPGFVDTNFLRKNSMVDAMGGRALENKDEMNTKFPGMVEGMGGWTPIGAVADAFLMCVADEDKGRGKCWVVSGEKGEPRVYPASFKLDDYRERLPKRDKAKM